MKKIYYAGLLSLFVMLGLAAGKLHAQAPDIEIGDGTSDQGLPIKTDYQYTYSQSIFLQEELNIEGQRIHKIAFYYQGGRKSEEQIRIYMTHTAQENLTTHITDGLELVYQGALPLMNQEGWIEIALTTPFEYNNEDNLLVAVLEDKPGFILNAVFNSSVVSDSKSVLAYKDLSPGYDHTITPSGIMTKNYRPNIRFWFEEIPQGAAMSIQPPQLYYFYIKENEEKSLNVTVINTGSQDLEITGINNNGLPFASNFTGTILPGESQNVDIRFVPQQAGFYNGHVTLESNSSVEPVHIYVEGHAVNELSIIETFENSDFPPEQWSVDPNTWTRRGFAGFEGNGNAYLNTGAQEGFLITPRLNVQPGDELVFYAAEQLDGVITVSHSFDRVNWTELETITLTRSWQRYVIDLDEVQGQGYIGFSGVPRVYLDYVVAPAIYAETAPTPSANPYPENESTDAFFTQDLTWNASALAEGYKVYLGTDNPPSNLVDGEDVAAQRHFRTPVLDAETTYFWKIVPYNQHGEAVECPVWSFTTAAYISVSTFPLKEGFESDNGAVPPAGWLNPGGHWLKTSNEVNSGQYAARVMYNHPTDAILITPALQIPDLDSLELIFYWKNGHVYRDQQEENRVVGHDTLYVEATADNGQSWNVLGTFSSEGPMDAYAPVNVMLNEYSGSEIYVRFRHSTNNSANYAKPVGLDDIQIQGALTEPEIWIDKENYYAGSIANNTFVNSEEFMIRNMGAGILTVTEVTMDAEYFTTTFEAEEVSLAFGEEYVFSFGFEPFETGEFSGTFTIQTNGGTAIVEMMGNSEEVEPFTSEGFEDGMVPPHGWMNLEMGEEYTGWMRAWDHAQPAHTGTFSAISFSHVPGWGDVVPDNWLITSKASITENQELAFWIATADSTYFAEHFEVYISTTTNRLDQFTDLVHEETLKPVHINWSQRVIDLGAYEGQEVYIAFRHTESVGQFIIKLDDIEIRDVLIMHAPYADPAPGEVEQGTEVQLFTDTPEAEIYYTLNGDEPTVSSTLYTEPVVINEDVTIKAVALKGYTYSEVSTFEYTVENGGVNVEPVVENDLHIYPNPANSTIWIEKTTDRELEVSVYDIFGTRVRVVNMTSGILSINVEELAAGVYFIEVFDGENSHKQKIVIN